MKIFDVSFYPEHETQWKVLRMGEAQRKWSQGGADYLLGPREKLESTKMKRMSRQFKVRPKKVG